MPTQADFNALKSEEEALFAPLEDEVIEMQIPLANGSVRRKKSTLGKIINAFTQHYEGRSRELKALHEELHQVSSDIILAREELARATEGPVKQARRELAAEIARLGEKLAKSKEGINSYYEEANSDNEVEAEWDRKVRDFMKNMS